jgi:hypothetical protein
MWSRPIAEGRKPIDQSIYPARSRPHLRRTRLLFVAIVTLAVIVCTIVELAWWQASATTTSYPGSHFNQGNNAIWISHTWVGDNHSPVEYQALAKVFTREQIRSIYVHVGPLDADGTIPANRFQYALQFTSALHEDAPHLRLFAWIGQIYGIGAGDVDISHSGIRAHIVTTAAYFRRSLGFDGIHYDIEPVPNNDNHFLDLLDETRAAMDPLAKISIATPNWIPLARAANGIQWVTGRQNDWWTTYYYLAVSQHVDQIVVMLYNTGMPTAPLYQLLVEQETAHVLRAVARGSTRAEVVIGIPTYSGQSRAFHSSAENIRTGLNGIISGLNYAFAGVAIYPEWLTTADDWKIYNHLWLGR